MNTGKTKSRKESAYPELDQRMQRELAAHDDWVREEIHKKLQARAEKRLQKENPKPK